MGPSPKQRAEQQRIAAALAEVGFVLPGTLTERLTRCGRPNCRCHSDPPRLHGPYHQWTRKVDNKTVTRIFSDEQYADYGPWFDNERELRSLVAHLEGLSLAVVEADPRWKH
ncbi:MAG: hypothetical protein JJLCMIEE_03568 [Acidimicrobiales bacterium]|nr:MAG: hypothetical protein EDR02_18750 [Actinomycetota bacterium]MBV6510421.1 hypothetical protein [Acidimicrobiales bacterium]